MHSFFFVIVHIISLLWPKVNRATMLKAVKLRLHKEAGTFSLDRLWDNICHSQEIYVRLRSVWDHHLLQLILAASNSSTLKASVAVLLDQVPRSRQEFHTVIFVLKVTMPFKRGCNHGATFASCCLIMGGAFYSNLCTTRLIQCDAEPSVVCHHHCLSMNLKHVTCGRPLSMLLRTCRLVELKCLCSLFRPTYSVCDVCFCYHKAHSVITTTQYDASP